MLLTASDVMTGWTIPCCYSQFRKVSPFAERLLAFSVFSISLSLFFFLADSRVGFCLMFLLLV